MGFLRGIMKVPELTEAERRVLHHGITPDCYKCEEAAESLRQKGYVIPENWQGVVLRRK